MCPIFQLFLQKPTARNFTRSDCLITERMHKDEKIKTSKRKLSLKQTKRRVPTVKVCVFLAFCCYRYTTTPIRFSPCCFFPLFNDVFFHYGTHVVLCSIDSLYACIKTSYLSQPRAIVQHPTDFKSLYVCTTLSNI